MCQMLYMATAGDQPLQESPELRVEPVEPLRAQVCQWFSLPVVRFNERFLYRVTSRAVRGVSHQR